MLCEILQLRIFLDQIQIFEELRFHSSTSSMRESCDSPVPAGCRGFSSHASHEHLLAILSDETFKNKAYKNMPLNEGIKFSFSRNSHILNNFS